VIWEETILRNKTRKWVDRAKLSDSRCPVVDVQFAPSSQGLRLAALSEDGCVRTYEPCDIMDKTVWQLREEFYVHAACASCLAWNPCRFDPPQLAIGATNASDLPVVKVWQYRYAQCNAGLCLPHDTKFAPRSTHRPLHAGPRAAPSSRGHWVTQRS
jgi:hypothetical protein